MNTNRKLGRIGDVVLFERGQLELVRVDVGERKVGVRAQRGIDVLGQEAHLVFAVLRPILIFISILFNLVLPNFLILRI